MSEFFLLAVGINPAPWEFIFSSALCWFFSGVRNIQSLEVQTARSRFEWVFSVATVPGSSVNSWDSWFIFNLRKKDTRYYADTACA